MNQRHAASIGIFCVSFVIGGAISLGFLFMTGDKFIAGWSGGLVCCLCDFGLSAKLEDERAA